MTDTTRSNTWPELPTLAEWQTTATAVHMWMQVVGKIRLELGPWINHSWGSALYVTPRGLTASADSLPGAKLRDRFRFREPRACGPRLRRQRAQLPITPDDRGRVLPPDHGRPGRTGYPRRYLHAPGRGRRPDAVRKQHVGCQLRCRHDAPLLAGAGAGGSRVHRAFRARYIGKVSPVQVFWGASIWQCRGIPGARANPSRWRPQLSRLGDAGGLFARARRGGCWAGATTGPPSMPMLSRARRLRRAFDPAGSASTTRGWASSCCRMRPCAPPPRPINTAGFPAKYLRSRGRDRQLGSHRTGISRRPRRQAARGLSERSILPEKWGEMVSGTICDGPVPPRRPTHPAPSTPAALPAHESAFAMTVCTRRRALSSMMSGCCCRTLINRVLTRELVYTGITRARRELHVAGNAQGDRRCAGAACGAVVGAGAEVVGNVGVNPTPFPHLRIGI